MREGARWSQGVSEGDLAPAPVGRRIVPGYGGLCASDLLVRRVGKRSTTQPSIPVVTLKTAQLARTASATCCCGVALATSHTQGHASHKRPSYMTEATRTCRIIKFVDYEVLISTVNADCEARMHTDLSSMRNCRCNAFEVQTVRSRKCVFWGSEKGESTRGPKKRGPMAPAGPPTRLRYGFGAAGAAAPGKIGGKPGRGFFMRRGK